MNLISVLNKWRIIMKHFLPSSVMLTPFLVKHYPEPEEDESEHPQESEIDAAAKLEQPDDV